MYRDNNKPLTPSLKNGSSKTVRMGNPRPGRGQRKAKGAESVGSVNGQTPRPGYKQFKPAGGGFGSIARPGGNQKIKG
jgi:hypothetical protein